MGVYLSDNCFLNMTSKSLNNAATIDRITVKRHWLMKRGGVVETTFSRVALGHEVSLIISSNHMNNRRLNSLSAW